jgi:C4-dicarboxylate-specific signal transduction histidine kinase
LLRVFNPDDISPTANDLRPVIRQCLRIIQPRVLEAGARLTTDLENPLPVLCQAEETQTVIQALLELALERIGPGSELLVIGCRAGGAIELEIADSGPTLPCGTPRSRFVFPRRVLASSRPLMVLQHRVADFDGRVWAVPCPQGGMAWTLRLPARVHSKRAA